MTEIQSMLKDMLLWYHDFCAEQGLTYYAVGGTLLGAVRHKGFIPWDDDIDVCMPRPDYERFLSIMSNHTGRYRAETVADGNKDFTYNFCKLYDTKTYMICDNHCKTTRGLFLDIFPFDGMGVGEVESKKRYKKLEFRRKMISAKRNKCNKRLSVGQNISIVLSKFLPFKWRNSLKILHKKCAELVYGDCEYVANVFGRWHEREVVKREWLGEPALLDFEDIQICCPCDYDKYLTSIYGDYMQPPPEEKRKPDHECLFLDLNRSYLNVSLQEEK